MTESAWWIVVVISSTLLMSTVWSYHCRTKIAALRRQHAQEAEAWRQDIAGARITYSLVKDLPTGTVIDAIGMNSGYGDGE